MDAIFGVCMVFRQFTTDFDSTSLGPCFLVLNWESFEAGRRVSYTMNR